MRYHVVLLPAVSQSLGSFGLSRFALLRVLIDLRQQLENQPDPHRALRDPNDRDCFIYAMPAFHEQGFTHRLVFKVNGTQASSYLFVEKVAHTGVP